MRCQWYCLPNFLLIFINMEEMAGPQQPSCNHESSHKTHGRHTDGDSAKQLNQCQDSDLLWKKNKPHFIEATFFLFKSAAETFLKNSDQEYNQAWSLVPWSSMSTEDKDRKKGPQIGIKVACIISVMKTGVLEARTFIYRGL